MNWFESIALRCLRLTPEKFDKAMPALAAIIADYKAGEPDIKTALDLWNTKLKPMIAEAFDLWNTKLKPLVERNQPRLEEAMKEIDAIMPAVDEVLKLVGANRAAGKPLASAVHATQQALKAGTPGTTITWLQESLRLLGYPVAVDGKYGEQTHNAVKRFQHDHKLTEDGWAGPQTVAILRSALEAIA